MGAVSHPSGGVTAGIDIGTTSVKAVAVDGDGRVLARVRVPHRLAVPGPGRLEHDVAEAWWRGPRAALEAVADAGPAAVAVSALTPSMAALDPAGGALGPGVLYDDERGRCPDGADPTASGEGAALLAWAAAAHPDAAGFWPAQAVAGAALGGSGTLDYSSACSMGRLFDGAGWDAKVVAEVGVDPSTLPAVKFFGEPVGTVAPAVCPSAPVLVAGGVDALCEQLVAGADVPGDVLVVLGSTLVVWACVEGWPEVAGLWTLPHLRNGAAVVGGPSNAGGLFVDWVDRLVATAAPSAPVGAVPVWWPHLRGERVPLHDPGLQGALGGLDLTTGPAELRRAAREASGFAARHILDTAAAAAPVGGGRVVVSGGGVWDRSWLQALADVLDRPVWPVAVPEGAALGAAWLARMGAGLEVSLDGASRWARSGEPLEPDRAGAGAVADRYGRYLAGLSAPGGGSRAPHAG